MPTHTTTIVVKVLIEPLLTTITTIESPNFQQKGNKEQEECGVCLRGHSSMYVYSMLSLISVVSQCAQKEEKKRKKSLKRKRKKGKSLCRINQKPCMRRRKEELEQLQKRSFSSLYLPLKEEWHLRPGISLGDLLLRLKRTTGGV